DVLVPSYHWGCSDAVECEIDSLSTVGAERVFPLVNFGMPIGKGKPCCAAVVGGRLVHPGGDVRIEESCIIDAARMFVQKYPGLRRSGVNEFRPLLDVFVNRIR